jgi:hypothetical protein
LEDDMDSLPNGYGNSPSEPSRRAVGPTVDPRQASIERQVAFKAVIDLIISGKIEVNEAILKETILEWTNTLANILRSAPPDPLEGARKGQEGKASLEALRNLNRMREALQVSVEELVAEATRRFGRAPRELNEPEVVQLRGWLSENARAGAQANAEGPEGIGDGDSRVTRAEPELPW